MVEASLYHLIDVPMTGAVIAETAHRLAGNVHRLKARKTVQPWAVQRFSEWVPVQVMSVRRQPARNGDHGALLSLKVMAGTSCPMLLEKWRSLRWLFHFARHVGFSRRFSHGQPGKLPYAVPEQYTTLRLAVLIEPVLSLQKPDFRVVDVSDSLKKWNRSQLLRRARLDPAFKCREGYDRSVPCHRCWRGYESCPAGTHRADLAFGPCKGCGEGDAAFDPDQNLDLCINCHYKATHSHRKED